MPVLTAACPSRTLPAIDVPAPSGNDPRSESLVSRRESLKMAYRRARVPLPRPLVLSWLLFLLTGCAPRYPAWEDPADFAFARAARVQGDLDLVPGAMAEGGAGDFLLENDRMRAILDRVDRPHGFAASGGNVLDAAPRGGTDLLRQVFTAFGDRFPRQARYEKVWVEEAGGPRRAAALVAEGRDLENPALRVRTVYRLEPGSPALSLRTVVTNTGETAVEALALGDVLEWEPGATFLPGRGTLEGSGRERAPWVASWRHGAVCGWAAAGDMEIPFGHGWCSPIVTRVSLAPGDSTAYERSLLVGMHDLASVAEWAYRRLGRALGTLSGTVSFPPHAASVPGALVWMSRPGEGPIAAAAVDRDGTFEARLPGSDYLVSAAAPGCSPSRPVEIALPAPGSAEAALALDAPSRFAFRVVDEATGRGVPARLAFDPLEGLDLVRFDMSPAWVGSGWASGALFAEGNEVWSSSGSGDVPLAPGRYGVTVSRGPEWVAARDEVVLEAGRTTVREFPLARAFRTEDAIAVEPFPPAAEELPPYASPGARGAVLPAEGIEAAFGHGEISPVQDGGTGLRLFAASVLGTLASVVEGVAPEESARARWAERVNAGEFRPAVAEAGVESLSSPRRRFPRSYVLVGGEDAGAIDARDIVTAIRAGRVVVTNGPWLALRVNGRTLGETALVDPGTVARIAITARACDGTSLRRVELLADGVIVRAFTPRPDPDGVVRFTANVELAFPRDVWLQLVARGGVFAFTNPVWVDGDGDGRWRPPGAVR
jgi:hypothetical protein